MKILHCIWTMGGGGAERQLAYLADPLAASGFEVHVALLHGGPNLMRLQASGAKIHRLPSRSNYDPTILPRLIRMIRSLKPDLVHTWLPQMDILGGLASITAEIPFLVSERSASAAHPGTWKDKLRLRIARSASGIVANSWAGKAYWESQGKGPDSIAVIRNGIPFDEIDRVPADGTEDTRVDSGSERIVFAGRFTVEKNMRNLFFAMEKVLKKRPRAVAILFGEGPLKGELVDFHRNRNLGDRMRILNYSERLWNVLKRADVFVSVSFFEGNPNTVLEAGACKCPLVLSDIPAHREIFDSASAWFVNPNSPDSISEGVLLAIEGRAEAAGKAETAYARISPHSVESMAREYCALYRRMFHR